MVDIRHIPVLSDNYIWLLRDDASGEVAVIDPAVGAPVLKMTAALGWQITQIWNTHWHPDHTGGNVEIRSATKARIIGPAKEADKILTLDKPVVGGDTLRLGTLAVEIHEAPGHTAGHILFHLPEERLLFAGDTLFPMGCGRLFEGTAEQMFANMRFLAGLPDDTMVYCAHEYTVSNGEFALKVEPDNAAIRQRMHMVRLMRHNEKPTVPTTIRLEKATNPFVRASSVAEFASRRTLKDQG